MTEKMIDKVKFDENFLKDVEIRLVNNEQELHQALKLLQVTYNEEGFIDSSDQELRVTPYHLLPETAVFVAVHKHKIIGTVSCIGKNTLGYPFSKLLSKKQKLEIKNQWFGEISSLAVHPEYRKKGQIFFALSLMCHQYTKHHQNLDKFYIAVNPKQIRFYRDVLQMNLKSRVFENYSFVSGAPAQVLCQDLNSFEKKWKEVFAPVPDKNNWLLQLHRFKKLGIKMPKKTGNNNINTNQSIMTPEILSRLIPHLTKEDQGYLNEHGLKLLNHLPGPLFKQVIRRSILNINTGKCLRKGRRIPTKNLELKIYDRSLAPIRAQAMTLAQGGIEFITNSEVKLPAHGILELNLSGQKIRLKIKAIRRKSNGFLALLKESKDKRWNQLFCLNKRLQETMPISKKVI